MEFHDNEALQAAVALNDTALPGQSTKLYIAQSAPPGKGRGGGRAGRWAGRGGGLQLRSGLPAAVRKAGLGRPKCQG